MADGAKRQGWAPPQGAETDPQEAALLRYFVDRFALSEPTAAGAIAYMEDLTEAIGRLRERLEASEARAAALDDALRRAGGAPWRPEADAAPTAEAATDPRDAAWTAARDGARAAREAARRLDSDAEFRALATLVGFEDAARALFAAHARRDRPRGDAAGFSVEALAEEAWPHALWRLDALLSAYYADAPAAQSRAWKAFAQGVAAACDGLQDLLEVDGVSVASAPLLTPFAEAEGEAWSNEAGALAATPIIANRLAAIAEDPASEGLVIDCLSMGYADQNRGVAAPARLITLARRAWI